MLTIHMHKYYVTPDKTHYKVVAPKAPLPTTTTLGDASRNFSSNRSGQTRVLKYQQVEKVTSFVPL